MLFLFLDYFGPRCFTHFLANISLPCGPRLRVLFLIPCIFSIKVADAGRFGRAIGFTTLLLEKPVTSRTGYQTAYTPDGLFSFRPRRGRLQGRRKYLQSAKKELEKMLSEHLVFCRRSGTF